LYTAKTTLKTRNGFGDANFVHRNSRSFADGGEPNRPQPLEEAGTGSCLVHGLNCVCGADFALTLPDRNGAKPLDSVNQESFFYIVAYGQMDEHHVPDYHTLGIAFPSAVYAQRDQDSRERELNRRERELNRREREEINREREEIRHERAPSRERSHNNCHANCMAESNRCNRTHGGQNAINGCGIQRVQCLSKC
jgi:hypothetical protein